MFAARVVSAAAVASAIAITLSAAPQSSVFQSYRPVDEARLKKPDDGEWLMIRRTYDGWGYSPLDQITPANVGRLQPQWAFSTGVSSGHQAAPLVNDGVMFVSTPGNQVIAIDARTGRLLWRDKRRRPRGLLQPPTRTRGVGAVRDTML